MANFKFITSNNRNVQNVNKGTNFNKQIFQNFVNNQQFNNAADYLNQFRFETDSRLDNKYKSIINNLRNQADFVQSSTANLTDDERDAFAFHYAITNNLKLPEKSVTRGKRNRYTDIYRGTIDNLGGRESDELIIDIKNNNENPILGGIREFFTKKADKSVDVFFNNLGYNSTREGIDSLSKLGVRITQDGTGKTSLRFSKSNNNIVNILNAISGVNGINVGVYGIENKNNKEITHTIKKENTSYDFDYGLSTIIQGDIDEISDNVFKRPGAIIEQAAIKSKFDESKSAYDGNVMQGSLIGLGFKSAAHAKIQEYRDRGLIDNTMYDDKIKSLDEELMLHIQSDLSEYDVYYSNSEDRTLDQVHGNEVKTKISDMIKLAINNNQKINIQEAHVNGIFGTLIEIPANIDSKTYHGLGNFTLDTNANNGSFEGGEGEKAQTRTIFIRNFDGSEDEQELVNDPKMQAIRRLTALNNTNGSYDLGNGQYLKANGNDSYSIIERASGLKANGSWQQINNKISNLSKYEAQQLIAKDFYAQDIARDLETLLTDENGNIDKTNAKELISLYSPIFLRKLTNLYNTNDENLLSKEGDSFMDLIGKILGINLRIL